MSTDNVHQEGTQARGSSPHLEETHGKDAWVRGIRFSNGTPEEWLANSRAEDLASINQRKEARWETSTNFSNIS
jgi:hypothetical protein